MPHVRVDDIQIYYEERGRGPALVFIAGLGGRPGQFAGLVDAFADRYRCITFDNRGGAGQTDKPPGPYSIARFASDTAGLLDALGVDRAHVAGFSMGGMIAQEVALRYPERCRSLILEGTAAGVDAYVERFIRLWVSARMHLPRLRAPRRPVALQASVLPGHLPARGADRGRGAGPHGADRLGADARGQGRP